MDTANHYLKRNAIAQIVDTAIREKSLNPLTDTAAIFYSFDMLREKIFAIKEAFPHNAIHTAAIKANPLPPVLKQLKNIGFGAEAASINEVLMALTIRIEPSKIFFDSPAKTKEELELALNKGCTLNVDSLSELTRVSEIVSKNRSQSIIGLRINPQIQEGAIMSTNVSGIYSKFGEPINEKFDDIIEAYKNNSWLKSIHCHIGSQGYTSKQLSEGVKAIYLLAKQINSVVGTNQIRYLNIGGGFPAVYHHNKPYENMFDYACELKNNIDGIFSDEFIICTEFGRYLHANAGFTISKCEYIKTCNNQNTIITHVGADLMIRECLNPNDWHHEISVLNHKGALKPDEPVEKYNIAGPLCFSGDFIAKNINLPKVEEGDYLVIHDTGGYTFSMWSRYNSRSMPKVIGIENGVLSTLKERESVQDVIKFWI